MFHREIRYAKHTHPNKPWQWVKPKYWGKLNPKRNDHWVFGSKRTEVYLLKFRWFNIERHILVKGTASPDDPGLKEYWRKRQSAKAGSLRPRQQKLARTQNNICPLCRNWLHNDEELHEHHVKPRSQGGGDEMGNLQLVHLYCHQQVHKSTGQRQLKRES